MSHTWLDELTVELARPVSGYFVLGRSRLGAAKLAPASAAGGGREWLALLEQATRVTVKRGGGQVGTATVELRDAADPLTDPDVRPGAQLRVRTRDGVTLFTGRLVGPGCIRVTFERDNLGRLVRLVTLTAVDCVAHLANVTRFGAVSGLGWETWRRRAARLLADAGVDHTVAAPAPSVLVLAADVAAMTSAQAAAEAARWSGAWVVNDGLDPARFLAPAAPFTPTRSRALGGLVPGRAYTVRLRGRWAAGVAPTIAVAGRGTGGYAPGAGVFTDYVLTFTATAATHQLVVTGDPHVAGVWVSTTPDAALWVCADVLTEGSVAAHLDLAARTGRGAWFVTRDDAVHVLELAPEAVPVLRFSDTTPPAPDPLHRSYLAAPLVYDTAGLVNDLAMVSRGVRWELDEQTGDEYLAPDDTSHVFADVTSRATWGPSSASVDVALYEDTWQHAGARAAWAAAEFRAGATPAPRVQSLTWLVRAGDANTAAGLELYDRVDVRRDTVHQPSRVRTLTHEITPTRWTCVVGLSVQEDTP